jgi:hypothetical protein
MMKDSFLSGVLFQALAVGLFIILPAWRHGTMANKEMAFNKKLKGISFSLNRYGLMTKEDKVVFDDWVDRQIDTQLWRHFYNNVKNKANLCDMYYIYVIA